MGCDYTPEECFGHYRGRFVVVLYWGNMAFLYTPGSWDSSSLRPDIVTYRCWWSCGAKVVDDYVVAGDERTIG